VEERREHPRSVVNTRDLVRWAADWVAEHAIPDPDARPAFTYRPRDLVIPAPPPSARAADRPPGSVPTVAALARAIRDGSASARDVVTTCLERIAARNAALRAFVTVLETDALVHAERLDAERRAGRLRGTLHGVPISVKDVIHVAGVPTTASSKVLDDCVPREDACAVARLRAAGAIIIGKTETHEFALGVTTPQSRNPWDPSRIPGGSTGGSAIAVATGMAPGALGTDTRASIRVPAALSGVVGFKPTFGLVPTHGVVTLSWSMDHVAPMAATVEDAALLLDVVAGPDPRDPNAVGPPGPPYATYAGRAVNGLRIGVPAAALDGAEPDVARAVETALDGLRAAGVALRTIDAPSAADLEMTNAAGMIVSRAEAATLHGPWLAARLHRYTPETRDQLQEASRVPATVYLAAQRLREEFRLRMLRLFADVDAIALPTSLVQAPLVGDAERFLLVLSRNCIPWSFIGFPAVSVPCGRTRARLPVGLQLVAPPFEDGRLVALGTAVEALALYTIEMPVAH
jgi:aspartyl-tRNA(Asn)/glutamyl-tRNA(Gln) amidotransferase subunit A